MNVVNNISLFTIFLFLLICCCYSKDPAYTWMGYAKAVHPSSNIVDKHIPVITHAEAKWIVPNDPSVPGAYFTPWFGIETSDNMNLLQPVNPWNFDSWTLYNEYFQWNPVHNYNSDMKDVSAGDIILGTITYNKLKHSYTLMSKDLTSGWSVSSTIDIQKENNIYKNYTIAYFVFEHTAECFFYPSDGIVTFYDIKIEYDGVVVKPNWSTGYVADNCDCRAHINNSTSIKITWKS